MAINEKFLQEELAVLQADFDKTKKQIETVGKELDNMKSNLNAIYGALQPVSYTHLTLPTSELV